MSTWLAIILVLLIGATLAVDIVFFGGTSPLFLAKQFVAFVEYLSFWR